MNMVRQLVPTFRKPSLVLDPTVRGKSLTCRRSCMVFDHTVRGKSLTCRRSSSKLLKVYDLQVCHIESQ